MQIVNRKLKQFELIPSDEQAIKLDGILETYRTLYNISVRILDFHSFSRNTLLTFPELLEKVQKREIYYSEWNAVNAFYFKKVVNQAFEDFNNRHWKPIQIMKMTNAADLFGEIIFNYKPVYSASIPVVSNIPVHKRSEPSNRKVQEGILIKINGKYFLHLSYEPKEEPETKAKYKDTQAVFEDF